MKHRSTKIERKSFKNVCVRAVSCVIIIIRSENGPIGAGKGSDISAGRRYALTMKEKKSTEKPILSVELFAMAFALLCFLSFICLVSGDALFGDLGLMMQRFFLGVFGYLAFPVLIGGIYLGVKGVIGFKVKSHAIKAIVIYSLLYALFIVTIIQTACTEVPAGDLGKYIGLCYADGISFSQCTAGGVLFAFPVYGLKTFLSTVGSYIFCSVALAFLTTFLFRTPLLNFLSGSKSARGKREKTDSAEKTSEKAGKEKDRTESGKKTSADPEEPEVSAESGDVLSGERPKAESGDSFGIRGSFEMKNDRDREKEYTLKLLYGDSAGSGGRRSSYNESFDRELEEKTDYIRRPNGMRGFRVESPMGNPDGKVSYATDEDDIDIDVSVPEKDVYVIRNDGGRGRDRIKSFDDAGGRSSGNEEESNNDYNRDRFTRPLRRSASDEENEDYGRDSYRNEMRAAAERRMGGRSREMDETESEADGARRYSATASRRTASTDSEERTVEREGDTPNADVLRRLSKAGRDRKRSDIESGGRPIESDKVPRGFADSSDGFENADFDDTNGREADGMTGKNGLFRGDSDRRNAYARPRGEDYDRNDRSDENESAERFAGRASYGGDSPAARPSGYDRPEPSRPSVTDDGQEESGGSPDKTAAAKTVQPAEKEEEANPIDNIPKSYRFRFPPADLLNDYKPDPAEIAKNQREQKLREEKILETINNPDIGAKIENVRVGPSITRFEISIPQKIPMRRVLEKQEDLNLWMAAKSRIRFVAPIPGTSLIGLEVPNSSLTTVGVKEIMKSNDFKNSKSTSIVFTLGKDMVGNPLTADLVKMPHLLVAGATGTGKSVFLNTLLISLIYKYSPDELRIVLVDPKIVEFSIYKNIPELLFGEIFTKPNEAGAMLEWMVGEMERRYLLFNDVEVRDINEYNEYVAENGGKKLFRILILMDEFADLMAQQNDKKRLDTAIGRLAAKARSAGIHIILATQRPTTDIVDGSIKTNFPSRIVFKMSSQTDAMVVMGEGGAEKLLGDGDMFYKVGKMSTIERAQGAFINGKEVAEVCKYVKLNNKPFYDEHGLNAIKRIDAESAAAPDSGDDADDSADGASRGGGVEESLLKAAMRIAIRNNNVSISMLQRKLGVGYPKAGKIVDVLEAKNYISGMGENNKRKINMTAEQFEQTFGEPL